MKKSSIILTSCVVILLCVSTISGMSYALFTDSGRARNHLRAGKLDIVLTRTDLEYTFLNQDGELEIVRDSTDVDFTSTTKENIFGMDPNSVRIVPTGYYEAELQISNNGNVAFDYTVELTLLGNITPMAQQLKATVIRSDGSTESKMLSELKGKSLVLSTGKMKVTDEPETFRVRIEMLDDAEYNANRLPGQPAINNNLAQNYKMGFDINISAVQATTAVYTGQN